MVNKIFNVMNTLRIMENRTIQTLQTNLHIITLFCANNFYKLLTKNDLARRLSCKT